MYINTEEFDNKLNINSEQLEKISNVVLHDYYDVLPEFSLTFVKPETIRELNRNYREVDAVTDVLSFESDGEYDLDTGLEYLGDIIICVDQVEKQAKQSGHSIDDEIALMEIHGLLHLLGYDHMEEDQKAEMWKFQDMYLNKCEIHLKRRPGEDFDF